MPPASASQGSRTAPARRAAIGTHMGRFPTARPVRRRRVAQADGDGEDEERLGGLLEGALGEVGGGEVGDGDQRRRQQRAARRRSPAARPARSAR